ncbi:hypothetical protein PRZ48_011758 [Zasmidium cellare]|uniref:Uncharacterized protein n=1 Tax=Zasmidium cellare TaxID=395010 RepID=A0ABR0E8A4_ZASCE|nr:hypothetical protein PRZ48_011758 [Zasmidium cellare]
MAKAKEAKAISKKKDAPAKAAKSSKTTKPKTSNLSEEKVVDSDSDNEAPAAKSPAKTAVKSKEAPKKSASAAKAASQKAEPKSKAKVVEKEHVESSSEESSEEESEDEKPAPVKPEKAPAKSNGVKRKAEESSEEESEEESKSGEEPPAKKAKTSPEPDVQDSSSEEDDGGSEEEEEKKPVVNAKKAEPVPEVDMQDSSSEEDESSGESEEEAPKAIETKDTGSKKAKEIAKAKPAAKVKAQESPEDEEDEEDSSSAPEGKSAASKPKAVSAPTVTKPAIESIPVKPFEPPSGYTTVDSPSLSSGSPFAASNLAGKQIWHIVAPSNVPLKSITEVALDAVKSSTPVLNHKGVDYVLAADKNHSTQFDTVFVPSSSGYQSIGQHVDTTLQLQQKIELPNLSKLQADTNKGSNSAADIAQAPVSDARPQPKGLRMRYKPPGFGRGDPGRLGSESDSSDEDGSRSKKTAKSLQFPKALGAHGASDKPDSGTIPATEKPKKSKKKRRDSDVEMVNGDSNMPPPESTTPQKKKKKQAKEGAEAETPSATKQQDVATAASPSEAKEETKEERAKRKEAKRLKKEAKKQAGGDV